MEIPSRWHLERARPQVGDGQGNSHQHGIGRGNPRVVRVPKMQKAEQRGELTAMAPMGVMDSTSR